MWGLRWSDCSAILNSENRPKSVVLSSVLLHPTCYFHSTWYEWLPFAAACLFLSSVIFHLVNYTSKCVCTCKMVVFFLLSNICLRHEYLLCVVVICSILWCTNVSFSTEDRGLFQLWMEYWILLLQAVRFLSDKTFKRIKIGF